MDETELQAIKEDVKEIRQRMPAVWAMLTEKGHCCPSMVGLKDQCAVTDTQELPCASCWEKAIAGDKPVVIKDGAYYCPDCDAKLLPQILPDGRQKWRCPACGKTYNIIPRIP